MPSIFGRFFSQFGKTSPPDVNAQKANTVATITTSAIQLAMQKGLDPAVKIPGAFAQMIASAYAVCHTDTYIQEKMLHGFQALLSATQLGFAIYFLFQPENEQCDMISKSGPCTGFFLTELLFAGTLSVSIAGQTIIKKLAPPTTDEEDPRESATPAHR